MDKVVFNSGEYDPRDIWDFHQAAFHYADIHTNQIQVFNDDEVLVSRNLTKSNENAIAILHNRKYHILLRAEGLSAQRLSCDEVLRVRVITKHTLKRCAI